jgi:SHS family lactate transporter-like MFS transporter
MTAFNFFSHGTQDIYPTFLQVQHKLSPHLVGIIAVIYNIGAICGGILFGSLSERWGRRRCIIIASLLSLPVIPLWAFSSSLVMLSVGAFLMQFMVQGAWGVIPAHLSELAPDSVRGFLPGFGYQCGVLISGSIVYIQAFLAERMSYAVTMAATGAVVFIGGAIVTALGKEHRGREF